MKIRDILAKKTTLSFEVFPPKTSDSYQSVAEAAKNIAMLKPDFMSVTYGAGGGTSQYTTSIAKYIQDVQNVTSLAHITCVSSSRENVIKQLDNLKQAGIENILALRGDLPKDGEISKDYKYAFELINEIKKYGDFCIGGACYPEGHIEAPNQDEDIIHLKEKVDAGCEFLTTQMFFDNNLLYKFLYKIREAGITVPIIAGIMPITTAKQLGRSVSLSGTSVPHRFKLIVEKFGDDPLAMKQAGIAYATEQIIDLVANGVKHIHIYSMNKPDVAKAIKDNLSEIIK